MDGGVILSSGDGHVWAGEKKTRKTHNMGKDALQTKLVLALGENETFVIS